MRNDERITTKLVSSLILRKAYFMTKLLRISPSLMLCFLVVLTERVLDRHIGWVSVYELNMVELTRSRVTVVDLAVG